jgi:hypothetical protein
MEGERAHASGCTDDQHPVTRLDAAPSNDQVGEHGVTVEKVLLSGGNSSWDESRTGRGGGDYRPLWSSIGSTVSCDVDRWKMFAGAGERLSCRMMSGRS